MVGQSLRAPSFEWRVQTGGWRWVILGAIGVAPFGCGGRSGDGSSGTMGPRMEGQGGSGRGNVVNPPVASGGAASTVTGGGSPTVGAGSTGSGFTGSGGTASGGTASGGGAPVTTPSKCEPPFTDLGGGFEQCANGMLRRPTIGTCPSQLPRSERVLGYTTTDAGADHECDYDSDCTDKPHGYCGAYSQVDGLYCGYGCVSDADCESGNVCLCRDPVGICIAATCATDGDCAPGLACAGYPNFSCGDTVFACQLPEDTCAVAGDCNPGEVCARGYDAAPTGNVPRACVSPCDIGRPFLVAGFARIAPEVVRSDWYPAAHGEAGVAMRAMRLRDMRLRDIALRDALRAGWLEQALMEHASVAAFARFSLQLLALGAPAELVERSASAMRDEIEHARACFELARRHSEGDVGPGALDLSGALDASDLESVVLGAIAEGCIGETVAAIEAAEACAHCEDEAARAVLERIARDETQHAELAWRFVAWALEVGPPSLAERARTTFAAALAESATSIAPPSGLDRELARHGLIAASLRAELRARVLSDVIAPCARALLGSVRAEAGDAAPSATHSLEDATSCSAVA